MKQNNRKNQNINIYFKIWDATETQKYCLEYSGF